MVQGLGELQAVGNPVEVNRGVNLGAPVAVAGQLEGDVAAKCLLRPRYQQCPNSKLASRPVASPEVHGLLLKDLQRR